VQPILLVKDAAANMSDKETQDGVLRLTDITPTPPFLQNHYPHKPPHLLLAPQTF